MPDVVVTVPINFRYGIGPERGLDAWIAEGDAAGDPTSGELWTFFTSSPSSCYRPESTNASRFLEPPP